MNEYERPSDIRVTMRGGEDFVRQVGSEAMSMTGLVFPTRPYYGEVYTGATGVEWMWDGVKWVAKSGKIVLEAQGIAVVQDIPPIDAPQGGLWFNSTDNNLYVLQGDTWYVVSQATTHIDGGNY